MFRATRLIAVAAVAASACAPRVTTVAPRGPSAAERLNTADALVRAGCFDCLVQALGDYQQLADREGLRAGAARADDVAGLLAIRERDLGLVDQHYLERARDSDRSGANKFLLDVVATIARRSAGRQLVSSDADIQSLLTARRSRDEWQPRLVGLADLSPLAAVTAVTFECLYGRDSSNGPYRTAEDSIPSWRETPLAQFSVAMCSGIDVDRLTELLAADPRFVEINYFLAQGAILRGDLEQADRRFQAAFDWRSDWPAAALGLANVAMTAEDFERAATFYDRTLALDAANADARLGRVRALSFAGRHADAIAAATMMLEGHWYTGDAYFWRAWNEAQLERNDAAWDDVSSAAKLVFNADVHKLTGILSIRRHDITRALSEFDRAHELNAADCETTALLGATHLELGKWNTSLPVLQDAVSCLDKQDEGLRAEIARLASRGGRDYVIEHRRQTLEADQRSRTQAWFNIAVASYNVGDKAAARDYAEKVASDEHFGERARQLLGRLRP